MSTENLDGGRRFQRSDGFVHESKCVGVVSGADWVMSNEQEQVDWLVVVDGIQEPLLLHHGGGFDDFGDIGVSGEVVENSKCHDTKT